MFDNTTTLTLTRVRISGWRPAVRTALVLILFCGGLYPLVATLVGGLLFSHQATGSLILAKGRVIGSSLVGQPVAAESYFHGRPSAAGYDPFGVAGSNLAPSNPDLRARAEQQAQAVAAREGVAVEDIPVDLVAASGSGIDPHLSPAAARLQVARIARVRGLAEEQVFDLVQRHTEGPVWGVLGQPRVNVLHLNLALDQLSE